MPGDLSGSAFDDRFGEPRPGDVVLSSLLGRHPHALVAAISESGVVVPVPTEVPLEGHRVLEAASTLDVVLPDDHVTIVELFARARVHGAARGSVRLTDAPDRPGSVYLVDRRTQYGAVIAVFCERIDDDAEEFEALLHPNLPARLARAHKDASAVYTSVDDAFCEILGYDRAALVGRRGLELVHLDDHDVAIANWVDMLSTPGPGRRVRLRHRHRDGHWVWLELTNHNRLDDPAHGDVVADMVDVSEEMAALDALRAREQLLHQLAETIPLGVFHSDVEGNILIANNQMSAILDTAGVSTLSALFATVVPEDRAAIDAAIAGVAQGLGEADLEPRVLRSDGHLRYCALRLRSLVDDDGGVAGIIGCVEDVTAGVTMRRRLEIQAATDPLTGCYNRASTLDAIESVIGAEGPSGRLGTAVVYVDLDRFKPINDRLGHAVGDELLREVASRLKRAVRSADVVGRIGGDEFLVVCAQVAQPEDAVRVAETISRVVCCDAKLHEANIPVRASFGVAWTADPRTDPEQLVAAADTAMYASKRVGRCEPVLADHFG